MYSLYKTLYTGWKFQETHVNTFGKKYPCTLCRKSFTQGGNLKIHALTHSREKPKTYLCTLCTKSFTYNGNLKSDMKKYWGENSYFCLCTKCFKNDGNLKKHTGTHLLEKLYACLLCTKSGSFTLLIMAYTLSKEALVLNVESLFYVCSTQCLVLFSILWLN